MPPLLGAFLQPGRGSGLGLASLLIGCRRHLAAPAGGQKVSQGVPLPVFIKKKLMNMRCSFNWRREPYLKVAKSLYCVCAEYPDYSSEWIGTLGLDDSFTTWQGVTSLHLWLVLQRLRSIGEKNVSPDNEIDFPTMYILYGMGQLFHGDIKQRLHDYPSFSAKSRAAATVFNHFQHVNFLYKLAYVDSDLVLAELLWREVCSSSPRVNADSLNLLVRYVRANYRHLSTVPDTDLINNGIATFLPVQPRPSREETKAWMRLRLKHALAPQTNLQASQSAEASQDQKSN